MADIRQIMIKQSLRTSEVNERLKRIEAALGFVLNEDGTITAPPSLDERFAQVIAALTPSPKTPKGSS